MISKLRRKKQKAIKKWKEKKSTECRIVYNRCNAAFKRAVLMAKSKSCKNFGGSKIENTPNSIVWKKFRAGGGGHHQKD